jgi:hypothetical protein
MLIIILLITAVVLFAIAAVPTASARVNLVALGLAFFAASFLVAHID